MNNPGIFLLIAPVFFCLALSPGRSGASEAFTPPGPRPDLYRKIKASVDSVRLIDTHEHQVTEDLWLKQDMDLFYWIVQPWGFTQNTDSDLLSAGMPEGDWTFIMDSKNAPEERWARLAPYWSATRYTSYAQPVRIAARVIHGVPDINDSTWRELNRRVIDSRKPGFRRKVLHEMAGIDLLILDKIVWVDSSLAAGPPPGTVMVKRFDDFTLEDNFVQPGREDIQAIAARYGVRIETLDDLLASLDKAFEEIVRRGYYVGLKSALAYDRIIRFEDTPRQKAEKIFAEILTRPMTREERRPFEDFMMHQVVRRAGKHHLPLQIHTGCQLGPGNDITNARPTLLLNLFQKYPQTRFVIFHGSFPYMGELTAIVKNYPNVYLDMCLMPVFSVSVAKEWLHKWLETLPVNKITFFGGDCLFPEGAYGHSVIARQIVAETLTEKVESGYLSLEEARQVARLILRDNAIKLYSLERFL
ncbi:MAG: amidohydrolase family protein [Candidatus Glassbacteria bacterium]|nr:amidohydrolase family protein [Candidatus Glassbacteria bacterium]